MLLVAIPCHKLDHLVELVASIQAGTSKPERIVIGFDRIPVPDWLHTTYPEIEIVNIDSEIPSSFRAGFVRNKLYQYVKASTCGSFSLLYLDCDVVVSKFLVEDHRDALNTDGPVISMARRTRDVDDSAAYDRRDDVKNKVCRRIFGDSTVAMHVPLCFDKASHCQSHNLGFTSQMLARVERLYNYFGYTDTIFDPNFDGSWGGEDDLLGYVVSRCFGVTKYLHERSYVRHRKHRQLIPYYSVQDQASLESVRSHIAQVCDKLYGSVEAVVEIGCDMLMDGVDLLHCMSVSDAPLVGMELEFYNMLPETFNHNDKFFLARVFTAPGITYSHGQRKPSYLSRSLSQCEIRKLRQLVCFHEFKSNERYLDSGREFGRAACVTYLGSHTTWADHANTVLSNMNVGKLLVVNPELKQERKWLAQYEGSVALSFSNPFSNDVQGDLLALPFIDGSFDTITCLQTLQHIENDEACLLELKRVLKTNGVCLLSTPWNPGKTTRHDKSLSPIQRNEHYGYFTHVRSYGGVELHQLLRKHFKLESMLDYGASEMPMDLNKTFVLRKVET